MPIPPGAWRFGTYAERELGGFPGIAFADFVFPWTVPPPEERPEWWPESEPGGWWNDSAPPPETQGWERNMDIGGEGHPNFPSEDPDLGIKIVHVAVRGLKNHANSPPRRDRTTEGLPMPGEGGPGNTEVWPYTLADGVQKFYEIFYMPHYLDPATRIVPWCAERDVRHALEVPPAGEPPPWDQADGQAAIEGMVEWFLVYEKDHGFPGLIAGWGLTDEPEQGEARRTNYTGPTHIADLRTLIRDKERAWRILNDTTPEADGRTFEELTPAEQDLRLRPTILTFSRHIVYKQGADEATDELDGDLTPEQYRNAADLFFYDEYPYKATPAQFQQWVNEEKITQDVFNLTINNGLHIEQVKRSLEGFRSMWRRLNQIGTTEQTRPLSDPLYRPVAAWVQANGYPYHPNGSTEGASNLSPTEEPDPEDMLFDYPFIPGTDPAIGPLRGLPTTRQLRFYTWATLFLGSEGLPCFSLSGIAAQLIQNHYTKVFHEVLYFTALRYTFHNRARDFGDRVFGPVTPSDPTGRGVGLIRSMALVFEYPEPPSGAGPETYLLLLNPTDVGRTVTLSFDPPLREVGGTAQQFVPWCFGEEDDLVEEIGPSGISPYVTFAVDDATHAFGMAPYSFALFKLLPVP